MKIIKLTHACLLVEINQKQLLIDPGIYTEDIPELPNLSAVVITHSHADHLNGVWLAELQQAKPEIPFYTVQKVADDYPNLSFEVVSSDQQIKVDDFAIDCWLNDHATIHADIPTLPNMAVMINDNLFYPGDSLYIPSKQVPVLACPASAPWLKISEVINYIQTIKAESVFPTHDVLLSDTGNEIHHRFLADACNAVGSRWHYAIPGEQLEI